MDTKDLVVNDGREGQVVENLRAVAPHVHTAILAQTLIVEPIHLRDLSTLVVATDQCDAVGIANLRSEPTCNSQKKHQVEKTEVETPSQTRHVEGTGRQHTLHTLRASSRRNVSTL